MLLNAIAYFAAGAASAAGAAFLAILAFLAFSALLSSAYTADLLLAAFLSAEFTGNNIVQQLAGLALD